MIIDVSSHFYPKGYLEALPKPFPEVVSWITSNNPAVAGRGRAITDLDYRISQMDKFGIDKQVLSLPQLTLSDLPSNIPVKEFNKVY